MIMPSSGKGGLTALEKILLKGPACYICGVPLKQGRGLLCSSARCKEEDARREAARLPDEVTAWHIKLTRQLPHHQVALEDEHWVEFREAKSITGFTENQLRTLSALQIFPVRTLMGPDGNLVIFFPRSRLRLAWRIFESSQKNRARRWGSQHKD